MLNAHFNTLDSFNNCNVVVRQNPFEERSSLLTVHAHSHVFATHLCGVRCSDAVDANSRRISGFEGGTHFHATQQNTTSLTFGDSFAPTSE